MEIIVTLAVLALAGYWIYDMSRKKESQDDNKPWPYGEKLPEGKIHVKSADVAPGKSADDIVEATAPATVAETVTTVVENKPAKKPAAKKTADKKPAVKRAPAKKKST